MENKEFENESRNEALFNKEDTVSFKEPVKKKKIKALYVGIICAAAGLFIGGFSGALCMRMYDSFEWYKRAEGIHDKVNTVQYILENEYLYDYDEEELADYAALGMTMALSEPYTVYYPKKEFRMFTDDGNGDFVGIGIVVTVNSKNNTIEIESVTNDGPAERAGIKSGDVLKAVDGENFTAMEFSQAVAKVRGTDIEGGSVVGKKVTLTVIRDEKELTFEVTREKIHTDSVESKMLDGGIGYIKILSFNTSDGEYPDTFTDFKTHFEELSGKGAKKLIIDVRDNGGGDLDVVSAIIDMIVPKGTIMYAEDKYGNRDCRYSDADEIDMPMVVLVNKNSASASELMTGALRDHNKAIVVGTKTYGKGVMQGVYPFTDGSGMVVTIAKYYTPKGTCVHDEGITPDFEVELTADKPLSELDYNEDNQLKKAVEILNEK